MRRWMQPRTSTPRTYEAKLGPPIVQAFSKTWGLDESLARHWWRALCESQWSEAVAWREAVIHFSPAQQAAREFVETTCSPSSLVALLELLVQEKVLYRQTASHIELRLLEQVNREGRWYDSPT